MKSPRLSPTLPTYPHERVCSSLRRHISEGTAQFFGYTCDIAGCSAKANLRALLASLHSRSRHIAVAALTCLFAVSCSDSRQIDASDSALDLSTAQLAFELDVEGRPVRVAVQQVAHVAPGLRSFDEVDGQMVERPTDPTFNTCQYQGTVTRLDAPEAKPAWAAITTCDGVTGALSLDHVLFQLERGENANEVRVFRASQHPTVVERATLRRVTRPSIGMAAQALTSPKSFLELVLVADPAFNALYGANAASRAVLLASYADAIYRDSSLSHSIGIVLVGYVSLSSNPFASSTAGETELMNFASWAKTAGLPAHDVHALLSGIHFDSEVMGFAYVGEACATNGAAIVRSTLTSAFDALTLAHELGHTMGMRHDGASNACPTSGYVMQALPSYSTSTPLQTTWSTCSDQSLTQWLSTASKAACLSNAPTPAVVRCGDGVTQGSEQCDCGGADCSTSDPCCDGANCEMKPGADCSSLEAADPPPPPLSSMWTRYQECTSPCAIVGDVALSWSETTGASWYEVERSSFDGVTFQRGPFVQVYSGPSTSFVDALGSRTISDQYRMRACATAGCQKYLPTLHLDMFVLPPAADCRFNGRTILHGTAVTAFAAARALPCEPCESERRRCNNGLLSGSYKEASCTTGPRRLGAVRAAASCP